MRTLFLLLLIFVVPAHAVASRITAQVDQADLVLGEALTLEVRLQAADAAALDTFTLDALLGDFDIAAISRSVRPASAIVTATVYPLRRGHQSLPALNFLGANSAPISLHVRDVGPTIPRVLIRTGIDPHVPQVREAALVYFEVLDNGSLQWTPVSAPDAPGIHLRPLAETQRDEMVDGTRFVVHRYAWAALPLRDGALRINFPRVNAAKFGARLRYAVPPLTFDADPIPAWVPVHVPVGALQVASEPLPATIETQQPFNWQLRVTGAGLSEQGIAKALSAVLRSNAALYFYPAIVQREDAPRATTPQQTFLVTLPLRMQQAGEMALPQLVFPFYDPARGQLDAVRVNVPQVTAVNPLVRILLRGGIGLLMLLMSVAIVVYLWRWLRRARRRALALHGVRSATNAAQLKAALLRFDLCEGVTPAATLRQWLRRTKNAAGLTPWVRQLEQWCYGRELHRGDWLALHAAILAELKRTDETTS